jgi:glycosyltransferase involved in cell wall biosynthesis
MLVAGWGEPAARGDGLDVWLRTPPPQPLPIGSGSAVFIHGAALHAERRISGLELTAGGAASPVMAHGMPSPGLAAELGDRPGAAQAIFWGIAPLAPSVGRDAVELGVRARLDDGRRIELPLARAGAGGADAAVPAAAAGPGTVAICMATHEPPPELFERQLESLLEQSHEDWICLISDDASSAEAFARIEELAGADGRFVVSRSPTRAGAYENFGRALAMVPAQAPLVALCDQDDVWRPEKLETLIQALGGARLAFSDMRVTHPDGTVIADTYWTSRQPNHTNFASLLLGNTVTGAASLFHRELLDDALPLPPRAGNLYHDHWLALVARATGEIVYVPRPLYDYVQHPRAVIGHAGANRGVVGGGFLRRLLALRGRDRERLRTEWRRIYFAEYCRLALSAVALEQRLGSRIDRRGRRALRLALALDRSPRAVGWLAARQLRRLWRDDSGGVEAGLLRGLAWSRGMRLRRTPNPLDDADLPPGIVGADPSVPAPEATSRPE